MKEPFILTRIDLQLFSDEGETTFTDSSSDSNDTEDTGDFDLASLLGDTDQQTNDQQDSQTGGEKTFTQAEIDRIVGERLSRERQKYQGYDSVQSQVQTLQELTGYSMDDLVRYAQQQAQEAEQQVLEAQAQESGMSPEVFQRLSQLEQQEQVRQIQAEENRLANDKDFGDFFKQNYDAIYQEAIKSRTNLETAMGKLFIKKYPEIRQQHLQAGEQQAMRQIQQRGNTLVDGATQSGETGGVQLSNEQLAMAKALGVNPQSYAKNMRRR